MAKKNPNPSIAESVAVIAEHVKIQTKILDRMDNRQYKMNETLVKNATKIQGQLEENATKVQEQHKNIGEKLKNYFRLIIILISLVAALVGIKLSGLI